MNGFIQKSESLKKQAKALYFAWQNPGTPSVAKFVLLLVVAYALSPIDLIPDFIPVLGYLDDLVILPLGIYVAIRLIPADLWLECQARVGEELPQSKFLAVLAVTMISTIWFVLFVGIVWLLDR